MRLQEAQRREEARSLLSDWFGEHVHTDGDPRALSIQLSNPDRAAAALAALAERGIGVSDFSLGQPSLDEVFFALTGHAAVEPIPHQDTTTGETRTHGS